MERSMRLSVAAVLAAVAMTATPAGAEERTVIGTIVALDVPARAISVADGKGVRWNFTALPDAEIDLSALKEGDRVAVRIARGTPLNMMTSADYLRKGDTVVKIPRF